MRLACVIPVFDNAATVGEVAVAASEVTDHVLVVDDGSTDGSADRVRAAASRARPGSRIEIVDGKVNRGKGAALVLGMRRARELGFTHAVTMDADGQHRASDVPALVETARRRPLAIVVGARDMSAARVPHAARVGRRISNFWTLRCTGYDLPDTTCGLRVYPVREVLDLRIRTTRYDYEGEVLIRGAWAGLELTSVPIDVWYPEDPAARVSHYGKWADSVRITVMYVRLGLRRLLPMGAAARAIEGVRPPKVRLRDTLRHLRELTASGTNANELALAIGVGLFIGATPLWGLHAALMLYIAARWRLNLVAAFLATNISFPAIAPLLVFAEIEFGHFVRHREWIGLAQEEVSVATTMTHLSDYLVGAFALAALLGIAAGLAILFVGGAVERRRMTA